MISIFYIIATPVIVRPSVKYPRFSQWCWWRFKSSRMWGYAECSNVTNTYTKPEYGSGQPHLKCNYSL